MAEPNVAGVAALISEPARAAMLLALLDGRALPAGELAYRAGVMPQTASTHLAKMMGGNLLAVERCGRHRYYRLANPEVGLAIEALAALAPPARLRFERDKADSIHYARTCYDHLAGRLGVALADTLLANGALEESGHDYRVTLEGGKRLTDFGIDLAEIEAGRRAFARQCLDWSERRHHIAGGLGAALAEQFFKRGWIKRMPESRALRLTDRGHTGLHEEFGLRL